MDALIHSDSIGGWILAFSFSYLLCFFTFNFCEDETIRKCETNSWLFVAHNSLNGTDPRDYESHVICTYIVHCTKPNVITRSCDKYNSIRFHLKHQKIKMLKIL